MANTPERRQMALLKNYDIPIPPFKNVDGCFSVGEDLPKNFHAWLLLPLLTFFHSSKVQTVI